jgi:hypothetical protein
MDELMKELKSIADGEGTKISEEWSGLQLTLLRESIPLASEMFEREPRSKAIICVGQRISVESFDEDDGVEKVGPNAEAYNGIGGGEAVACRMRPAMGAASADKILEFFDSKELIMSLHNATDYISVLLCVKMKTAFFSAMTTQAGVAVSINHTDSSGKGIQEFYVAFDEKDSGKEALYKALTPKQRRLVSGMVEAQVMPNHLKELSSEGYQTVMKLIQLNGHDHFADDADDAS